MGVLRLRATTVDQPKTYVATGESDRPTGGMTDCGQQFQTNGTDKTGQDYNSVAFRE